MMDGIRKNLLLGTCAAALAWCGLAPSAKSADDSSTQDLNRLSIEELANIEISSVSKKAERLSTAPAAIYVITSQDIERSGTTRIPEILRLAPNLQVASTSSSAYAISARGFNGGLANKLLVLIDGRSVYTPLYGGVYWDVQDTMAEDIARIEVISGPGATLWGANAVNGVINITTKSSADTQGGILTLGMGNYDRSVALRYGGRISDSVTYRVYAKGDERLATRTSVGGPSRDGWRMPQGGFRVDWTPADDIVTVQGDIYRAAEDEPAGSSQIDSGGNVMARWVHKMSGGSSLQIQAYYDRTQRYDPGGGFSLDIYDVDVQHSFTWGWNDIVWGGGYRVNKDTIHGAPSFFFVPANRTLDLANAFVQDTVSLSKSVRLTVGVKLEDEPFTGLEALPSARLSWKVSDQVALWGAVSRAVRAATRFDRDVVEKLGAVTFLTGGPNFQPEKVMAYEVGARVEPSPRFSFSVSTFYNDYDDLRSVEVSPTTGFLPLMWGNRMVGKVYGVEAWANYAVAAWWRLSAGFNVQHQRLKFEPGSSGLGGIEQAGNDPDHQISLRSSMDVLENVALNADLRYVGALPNPRVPPYVELGLRLDWQPVEALDISISGRNLLRRYHREFNAATQAVEVPRSFFIETRWRF